MTPTESPRTRMLLSAPIGAMLYKLAAPNVAATIMLTVMTFADAWFVGQLGTVALASLALVFPFQTLMQMTAAGAIGGGVTSAVSRAIGRGDIGQAQTRAWHGLVIGALMALLYMMGLGVFAQPVFSLLGATGAVLDGAVAYARILFGGALAVWLLWTLAAVLRGLGDTVTPARAVLVSGAAQIVLAGLLTLGWGPIPSIGIGGPAVATIVCQGLAALYLGAHWWRGQAMIKLRPQAIRLAPLVDIMRVGGLSLVNAATIALTVITVTGLVGHYGTEALAGYGLGSRLELMLVPIAFGVGGVLTVAVGTNIGAQQFARARRIAWTGGLVTFLITSAIGLAVAFNPALWLNLFTADAKAYAYGALYLGIAGPLYGFFGGGQTLYFASQGTGKMLLPIVVGVIRFLVVAGIGVLAIAMSWAVNAVFIAVAVGLVLVGIGMAGCMRTTAWRTG